MAQLGFTELNQQALEFFTLWGPSNERLVSD